jgi:hypothetical protein
MTFTIKRAESLSRGELLLRTFFGVIYIYIPHGFLLIFVGLWAAILAFISWWAILFTGRYPQSFFEFQVGLLRWVTRLRARQFNLEDGYPAFGIDAKDDAIQVDVPYPSSFSRGLLLLRLFFGWAYVGIPHGFCLVFLAIAALVANFIGFWIILFTGQLPEGLHNFTVGFLRWGIRVNLYLGNMTDTYPPFSLD